MMKRTLFVAFVVAMLVAPPFHGLLAAPPTFANGISVQQGANIAGGVASSSGSVASVGIPDPSAPTPVFVGQAGTTTYTYYLVGHDAAGVCGSGNEGVSNVSPAGSVTNANSTLSNLNYVSITVPTTYTSYDVLKGSATAALQTCVGAGSTVTDTGQATTPYTAPTANTTSGFHGNVVDTTTVNATTVNATTATIPTVNATTANVPTVNATTVNATTVVSTPGQVVYGTVVSQGLPPPPPPSAAVTSGDTTGSTSYSYSMVTYGHSSAGAAIPAAQSPSVTVTNGPATLSATDSVTVSYPNGSGAAPVGAVAMDVLKNVGGTWEVICSLVPLDPLTGGGSCVDSGQSPTTYSLPTSNATVDLTSGTPFPGMLVGGGDLGIFYATRFPGVDACAQLTNAFNAVNAAGGGVIVASYAKPQTCTNQIQDLNAQSATLLLNGTIKSTTPFSNGLVYITPVSRTIGVQIVGAVPVSMYGIAYNPAAATIDYEPTSGSQPIINYNGGTTNGGTQSGLKNLQFLGNSAVTSGYYYRALTGTDFQIENVVGYSTTSIPTGAVIDIASAATSGGNWDFPHISGIATGNWATALSFNASVGNSENGNLSNVFCNNSTAAGPCATLSNIFGWSIKRIGASAAVLNSNQAAFSITTGRRLDISTYIDNVIINSGATGTSIWTLTGVTDADLKISSNGAEGYTSSACPALSILLADGTANIANVRIHNSTFFDTLNAISYSGSGSFEYDGNIFNPSLNNTCNATFEEIAAGASSIANTEKLAVEIPDNAALNSQWGTRTLIGNAYGVVLDVDYAGTCTTYPVFQLNSTAGLHGSGLTGPAVTAVNGHASGSITATNIQATNGLLNINVNTAPAGCGSTLGTTHFYVVAHLVR